MNHIESMIEGWWKSFHFQNPDTPRPRLTKRVQNKKIVDGLLNAADLLGESVDQVQTLMKLMLPKQASDGENISYFDSYNKYMGGLVRHRTKTTAGRFFRRIFPKAPDQLVEAFAAFWQTNILFDDDDFVLHVGNTKEDFKRAFTSYVRTRGNFSYAYDCASISDSCMRYPFSPLPDHPSVVYASGDFIVVTVRNKKGKTRARCVVGVKDGKYIPNRIYSSCNHSTGLIKDYLKSVGALEVGDGGWHGLKLLRVPYRTDRFLCPYIDNYRYVRVYDADYLVIGSGLRDTSNSTAGVVAFGDPDNPDYWACNDRKRK
jgi:hypothetical protein